MTQHGAQSHDLPYAQPDFDAGLAAGMASLGLQGSLMDDLQCTQWQARLLQPQTFLPEIFLLHVVPQTWGQT